MRIKALIEILQNMPQDLHVFTTDDKRTKINDLIVINVVNPQQEDPFKQHILIAPGNVDVVEEWHDEPV